MTLTFVEAANQLRDAAGRAIDENRLGDAFSLLELAFTSALMDKSRTPISFKLDDPETLPHPLAATEHVIVQVSRRGIVFHAKREIIAHPLGEFLRFPMVGEFFSNIAQRLPEEQVLGCVVDLGDGNDAGDYPRIAYSSARDDAVLVPDPYFYMNDNYDDVRIRVREQGRPWRERADVVLWRGTAGGARTRQPGEERPLRWDWLPRLHLCSLARESAHSARLDIGLTSLHQIAEPHLREGIEQAGFVRPFVPKERFPAYRYLLDIDGWANSWSLLDKLICGSTIIKVASPHGYRQWYYGKLVPWVNYVPVAADLGDFDGVMDWISSHEADCEEIAAQGAALAAGVQLRPALAEAEAAAMAILRLL